MEPEGTSAPGHLHGNTLAREGRGVEAPGRVGEEHAVEAHTLAGPHAYDFSREHLLRLDKPAALDRHFAGNAVQKGHDSAAGTLRCHVLEFFA